MLKQQKNHNFLWQSFNSYSSGVVIMSKSNSYTILVKVTVHYSSFETKISRESLMNFHICQSGCTLDEAKLPKGPFTRSIENAAIEASSMFHRIFRGLARNFR